MLHLPPPLFKYAKRVYPDDLIRRGRIRVGTLHDYRKIEKYSPMIGDEQEGVKINYYSPAVATLDTLPPFAAGIAVPALVSLFGAMPDPATTAFINSSFTQPEVSGNCWLYCLSARLRKTVMNSMDANYDSCVRIDWVEKFFRAVEQEMIRGKLAAHGHIVPCVYGRYQHYTNRHLRPVALKGQEYAIQEEVRFVYCPAEEITSDHVFLTIPKLRDFCEAVPLEDMPE